MADRDTEILALKAQIAALEARPPAGDLDWLKNSRVMRRAEFAVSPFWMKVNVLFIAFILFILVGVPVIGIWWNGVSR